MALSDIPSAPGAYVLLLDLQRPLRLAIPSLPRSVLAPGRYAYCGSARGSGGLRARIARHLQRNKKLHWHVDRITAAARITAVLTCAGGDECALAAGLLKRPGVSVPVLGFGSSDCRRCPAHLLALPGASDARVPEPGGVRKADAIGLESRPRNR